MKRLFLIFVGGLLSFQLLGQANILDSLVINAFRLPTAFKTLTLKTGVISQKQIKQFQPQTAADLLGLGGEVFIQKSQQSGGSPMIRGFGTNRLLLAIDGVRMNTAIFRAGNLQQVVVLDPFVIEKAEICYGPGSVMHGSDAIGGVISFKTIQPKFEKDGFKSSAQVASRFSSANNEFTYHGRINLGSTHFASLTAFTANQFGDLKMGSNGPNDYLQTFVVQKFDTLDRKVQINEPLLQSPSAYSQFNILQKFRFEPNKHLEIEWTTNYSKSSNNPRYDRLNRLRTNGNPYSAEWYYGPQIWLMNLLEADFKKANFWFDNAKIHLAFQQFQESRHDRNFNDPILKNRIEKVNAYSLNLDFEKHFGIKTNLRYGAEWVGNQVKSTGTNLNIYTQQLENGPSRYPNSFWQTGALYAAFQYTPAQKHHLNAGIRANYFAVNADFSNNANYFPIQFENTNSFKPAFTGALGWVYNATATNSFRFNLSSGFRAPNVDDLGKVFDSEPGAVLLPNNNLNAEQAWQAESGLNLLIWKYLTLDFCGYYTYLNGAMVRRSSTVNGLDSLLYDGVMSKIQTLQNGAFARVYGFHAIAMISLPFQFSLRGTYNFQKGIEETEDGIQSPMVHLSPSFGNFVLSHSAKQLETSFYLNWAASMQNDDLSQEAKGSAFLYAKDANGLPYSPAWQTLNFRISYTFKRYYDFQVALENILDERYRTYRSGISAAGRNLVLSVRLRL